MPQTTNEIDKDILLSHFSLENLHEAVFWIRSNGQIFNVNQRACEMTGRTKEELLQMTVPELNASEMVQDFPSFWKKLKQKKKIVFEAQHRHKEGYLYDVEITGNYIEHGGEEFSCSIVRSLGKEKMEQQLLRTISEATSGLTGKYFLQKIAKSLSTLLQMRFATIAQCKEGDTTEVRTVCIASGETVFDNIDYDTKGRPCELILQDKEIFVPKDVQKNFPEAKGIEASLGAPIHSSVTGKIIGHIIVSHTEPVSEDKNQTTILKIFASRIGAELERMKAEEKLQQKNSELQNRIRETELYHYTLENLNEDVYWVDSEGNFIQVNQSAGKTTGFTKEELLKMTVFDINPSENKKEWLQHWQQVKKKRV